MEFYTETQVVVERWVTKIDGDMAGFQAGAEITVEWDIDPDAWYFRAHGARPHAPP